MWKVPMCWLVGLWLCVHVGGWVGGWEQTGTNKEKKRWHVELGVPQPLVSVCRIALGS